MRNHRRVAARMHRSAAAPRVAARPLLAEPADQSAHLGVLGQHAKWQAQGPVQPVEPRRGHIRDHHATTPNGSGRMAGRWSKGKRAMAVRGARMHVIPGFRLVVGRPHFGLGHEILNACLRCGFKGLQCPGAECR